MRTRKWNSRTCLPVVLGTLLSFACDTNATDIAQVEKPDGGPMVMPRFDVEEPVLPIVYVDADEQIVVSGTFDDPGAPSSTFSYHVNMEYDSTNLRLRIQLAPGSIPEQDPTDPSRLTDVNFDTFTGSNVLTFADGSTTSMPQGLDQAAGSVMDQD
jgi:hypothetical protein